VRSTSARPAWHKSRRTWTGFQASPRRVVCPSALIRPAIARSDRLPARRPATTGTRSAYAASAWARRSSAARPRPFSPSSRLCCRPPGRAAPYTPPCDL